MHLSPVLILHFLNYFSFTRVNWFHFEGISFTIWLNSIEYFTPHVSSFNFIEYFVENFYFATLNLNYFLHNLLICFSFQNIHQLRSWNFVNWRLQKLCNWIFFLARGSNFSLRIRDCHICFVIGSPFNSNVNYNDCIIINLTIKIIIIESVTSISYLIRCFVFPDFVNPLSYIKLFIKKFTRYVVLYDF